MKRSVLRMSRRSESALLLQELRRRWVRRRDDAIGSIVGMWSDEAGFG